MTTSNLHVPEEISMLTFTSPKTVVAGTEIQFSGDLLFSWPYKWDDGINNFQHLVNMVAAEALKFLNNRLAGKWGADPLPLMKDAAWIAVFSTPTYWRETALKDDEAFRKLTLYVAYCNLLFLLDDAVESLAGDPGHLAAARNCGRLVYKILLFELETLESLYEDPHFKSLTNKVPSMKYHMFSMLDVAHEMKRRYNITAFQSLYLARSMRYVFELQTWFDSKNMSHFYNPALQQKLRAYSSALDGIVEFWMLLDGIVISPAVRDNFYWKHQYEAARVLCYLLNDIFSAKKEFQEKEETGKPIDNTLLICMELENITFEEALAKVIKQHNKKLLEFYQDMKYITEDSDLLFELKDQEKAVFYQSLECMGITISFFAQAHLVGDRYKMGNVTHSFEPFGFNQREKI